MFCSKCGSEIKEEGAMFCPNCGQGLQMGTQVPPVSATKTNIKTGFKSKSIGIKLASGLTPYNPIPKRIA